MVLQISISFLDSVLPESKYRVYDAAGVASQQSAQRATYSLLPIVAESNEVTPGATWWVLPNRLSSKELKQAREKDVRFLVISEQDLTAFESFSPELRSGLEVVVVPDAWQALRDLAKAWRSQFAIPVIGITGSVGKTTTIHILKTIFAKEGIPAFFTDYEQTSLLRVMLSMLHLSDNHNAAFFEMGIDQIGDMAVLTELVEPTMAIITSISHAHTYGISSHAGISEEKRKIFANFTPSQIGIVCGDGNFLINHTHNHPVVKFGFKERNVVRFINLKRHWKENGQLVTEGVLQVFEKRIPVSIPGNHNGILYAAMAASSVCYFLHMPLEAVAAGLAAYHAIPGRFQPLPIVGGRGTLINDCYDANPESMRAAIFALHEIPQTSNKIAVLGDMLELGDRDPYWHFQIGRDLYKARSINELILVGPHSRQIAKAAPVTMGVMYAQDWQEAQANLEKLLEPAPGMVLVKASHAMHLDRLVKSMT